MGQVNQPSNLLDQIKDLRRQFEQFRKNVGLASAILRGGGLTLLEDAFLKMVDDNGVEVLYAGPNGDGKQVFALRREGGAAVLATFFTVNGQAWANFDKTGRIVVADDADTGGLARPWLPVPMYPKFTMAASSVYSYMNLPVASVTSETTLWEGRIGLNLHPYMQINGVWGQASGSNSATYRLKVGGVQVGTWSTGTVEESIKGPFDISAHLESAEPKVELTVTASGTGNVACQVYGLVCRQTP